MPEINEVRKYADFILKKCRGKNILEIKIVKGRYKKHGPFDKYKELVGELPLKLLNIKTKGKFLYIELEKGFYILSTLGLSGGWNFYNSKTKKNEFSESFNDYLDGPMKDRYMKYSLVHRNIEFRFQGGILYFYDMMSFGTMKVIRGVDELEKKLATIGPDIMDSGTTFDVFKERIQLSKREIGLALMNQRLISGIGNYLRADILWMSRISPFRLVGRLSDKELRKIYKNTRILTWGEYDRKKIAKSNKLPINYGRDFFVYREDKDIYGNPVKKEELYEGSQKRFIYWVPTLQTN